ncbi:MAG TPA: polyphosphate kinase 2 family protein [Draconibacterium sp.]|nr:polyphosphate kinase 2 family protein [Draconibacterium sp.]
MKKSLISRKELDSLSHKELIERAKDFAKQYCVGDGKNFSLKNYPTDDYPELKKNEKQIFKDLLQMGVETLASMQDKMYAQDKWSLLIIFQAMDAAGKDGAIKHVMSGLNPQGCEVNSFKAPSAEEIDHDFLWRCAKRLPERGRIGIFNRSYYEEVLVVRVHQQILQAQKIPEKLITEDIWDERFQDIRNFEEHLHRNGTIIIKFFLNISPDEQKKRFIERIDNPDKNWKFSASDAKERKYWNDYMNAYEQLIINTSTENSPWYVIPADDKPYARIAVAAAIISAMDSMDLKYPEVGPEKIAELQKIREELMGDE